MNKPFARPSKYAKIEVDKDAKKIYVITEGSVREPAYFKFFKNLSSNIDIEIIPSENGETDPDKLRERAEMLFFSGEDDRKYCLSKDYGDQVWFVIDTDHWEGKIENLKNSCSGFNQKVSFDCFYIAESNPSFEIWLYYHFFEDKPTIAMTASELKSHLHMIIPGGVDCRKIGEKVMFAISNSKYHYENVSDDYLYTTQLFYLAQNIYDFVKDKLTQVD